MTNNKARLLVDDPTLIKLIDNLCSYWYINEIEIINANEKNELPRHQYENSIWLLGETIRRCLSEQKRKREVNDLLDKVALVADRKQYGYGRVAFILILSEFGNKKYVDLLRKFLHDDAVQLATLEALRIMKEPSVEREIMALFTSTKKKWIMKECEKYFRMLAKVKRD
ncbi:hypothetical protein HYN56_04545 [Flavobacterium crocinum]|uniref:HEAT repeat domain-containing protein n=2 Tax=Flavobacterium crocinum TaxID=2183896 RepID=A0A2S1YHJ7_9FLAO|nr:hypothetical protein HYN56_04545 [Flavobacterium crocinum]